MLTYFFFFNVTATTEIYPLSLHDALPISFRSDTDSPRARRESAARWACCWSARSEEHTSELQSPMYLVCRLLLEKKNIPYLHHLERHGAMLIEGLVNREQTRLHVLTVLDT